MSAVANLIEQCVDREHVNSKQCQPKSQLTVSHPSSGLLSPTLTPESSRTRPTRPVQSSSTAPAVTVAPGNSQGPVTSVDQPKPKPAPASQRQPQDKSFVEKLVYTATDVVQLIWPLAAHASLGEPSSTNPEKLPLPTFIQEVLRRSKSSFSTLQVALYYLVLLKDHVPTAEQYARAKETDDKEILSRRALMCGRRMFLTALILAAKYLQDHNYSARAWSKISGLDTREITSNELVFFRSLDYNLHIKSHIFQKWNEIVVRLTSRPTTEICWTTVVPLLTPQFEKVEQIFWPCSNARVHAWLETASGPYEETKTPVTSPSVPADASNCSDNDSNSVQQSTSTPPTQLTSPEPEMNAPRKPPSPCTHSSCSNKSSIHGDQGTPPLPTPVLHTGAPDHLPKNNNGAASSETSSECHSESSNHESTTNGTGVYQPSYYLTAQVDVPRELPIHGGPVAPSVYTGVTCDSTPLQIAQEKQPLPRSNKRQCETETFDHHPNVTFPPIKRQQLSS